MSDPSPKIISNLNSEVIQTAQKYVGTSHGYSILSLLMIDKENRGYNLEVLFDSLGELQNAADQIFGVLERCESNRVLFRSYQVNGVFMTNYNGLSMVENDSIPCSPDDYKNFKVILDTYYDGENVLIYKFYRWNEVSPRILKLKVESS